MSLWFLCFFIYFNLIILILKKCPCVNVTTCHMPKSMFYIKFGPDISYFE